MERKNDPGIQEDTDRGSSKEQGSEKGEPVNTASDNDASTGSDAIKNASAAGLGAIGRNDQRQTGSASDAQNEY